VKALVLGATGLAGQAMYRELVLRGASTRGAARRASEIILDISDAATLSNVLENEAPDLVVNAAGLINLATCEVDTGLGWLINARPLATIARWSRASGRPFIHISTDHFYTGEGPYSHSETESVDLVNEYAKQKYAGEAFALTSPDALVLRTSLVGIRGSPQPSFAEWAVSAVRDDAEITLFSDAWTSSIDVESFARAALDLFLMGERGLYNVASRSIFSKEEFVREIARQSNTRLTRVSVGSVKKLYPTRASNLGLDVSKAESALERPLPTLREVVASVLTMHHGGHG